MNDEQIKHMAERFLGWKLPAHFTPDAGISFKAEYNENTTHPMRHEPTGTNLFCYEQAADMVRHMLEGMPEASAHEARQASVGEVQRDASTVEVTSKDLFEMHRRLGMAEGLLMGWLYAGTDTARAHAATKAFLDERQRGVTAEHK